MSPPALAIIQRPLSYVEKLETRALADIRLVVLHCTELPDLPLAREYGERILYPQSQTGNSGHFYIDRDGRVEQWVAENRIAHHVRGHNAHSIGIELVNRGRYPNWLDSRHQAMTESYPDAQIDALAALIAHLEKRLPHLAQITGHEMLDTEQVPASDNPQVRVSRKRDPGPMFPWQRLLAACRLQFVSGSTPPPPL
ncbi:N-acetylmuramoyl-L-alanine amidase [Lysobacteraceae bacterium NML120232]|nr:N-acetylmuramoyl-L-alanine amidase [Xanthomonadaceae bacterium NML120232]